MQELLQRKAQGRLALSRLPLDQKLAILDQLRAADAGFGRALRAAASANVSLETEEKV